MRYVNYETAGRIFHRPEGLNFPMAAGAAILTLAAGAIVGGLTSSPVTGIVVASGGVLVMSSAHALYAGRESIAEMARSVLVFCGCREAPLAAQAQGVQPATANV